MHNGIDEIYVEWLFKRANALRAQISGHASLLLHGSKLYVDQKSCSILIHLWKCELTSIEVELADMANEVWLHDEITILQ